MKKIIGVLFLIIGLSLIVFGVTAITDAISRGASIEGKLGRTFSDEYRNNNDDQKIAGAGFAFLGLIFFSIGIMLATAKSGKRKQDEASIKETILNLERISRLKEQGVLTEDEFLKEKKKILE